MRKWDQKVTKNEAYDRVDDLLVQVGLRAQQATLYPHEFSGGQRQRLALAAALVGNPKLIVLDEPVSALDVSIQAQIMNLLKELQDSYGVGFLLVAHNLATVRYLAHEVAVMYLGEIVEQAETDELYDNTLHPYTKALFSAALTANPKHNPWQPKNYCDCHGSEYCCCCYPCFHSIGSATLSWALKRISASSLSIRSPSLGTTTTI